MRLFPLRRTALRPRWASCARVLDHIIQTNKHAHNMHAHTDTMHTSSREQDPQGREARLQQRHVLRLPPGRCLSHAGPHKCRSCAPDPRGRSGIPSANPLARCRSTSNDYVVRMTTTACLRALRNKRPSQRPATSISPPIPALASLCPARYFTSEGKFQQRLRPLRRASKEGGGARAAPRGGSPSQRKGLMEQN